MRLPNSVIDAVNAKKVRVYRADRGMTKFWNERRSRDELRYFCGWYWYVETGGRATTEHGPFPTRSAAVRDAFDSLNMHYVPAKPMTTQVRGSNVVDLPRPTSKGSKQTINDTRALRRRLKRLGVG